MRLIETAVRLAVTSLIVLGIVRGSSTREVAITIDDLPRGGDLSPTTPEADRLMTEKLLQPFKLGHIPLIGFVNECHHTGELRSLLTLWVKAGAELGNHTCSHPDLNRISVEEFEQEILKGEAVTREVTGHQPRYLRYPFLHTGPNAAKKEAIASFLSSHGYRSAPVTLDNSDYLFAAAYAKALARNDTKVATRVRDAYLPYMESIFAFFEARSVEVTGHEIRQILLIHASQLNADTMPDLLAMMRRRGYSFVSLERALEDPAYQTTETYAGPGGFSWIHRWSMTKGMKAKAEPEEPEWVRQEAGF